MNDGTGQNYMEEVVAERDALRARVEALEEFVERVVSAGDRFWIFKEGSELLEQSNEP